MQVRCQTFKFGNSIVRKDITPFVAYWGFALMVTLPEKGRYRHHATRRSQESSVALVILL